MSRVSTHELNISTTGRGIIDVTGALEEAVHASEVREGLVSVFIRHTSASLLVSENADPDVLRDLERFLSDLVKDGDPRFIHTAEGPDDMPAHVRTALTITSVSFPLRGGELRLGTWQALYVWEHRKSAHRRTLDVTIIGE